MNKLIQLVERHKLYYNNITICQCQEKTEIFVEASAWNLEDITMVITRIQEALDEGIIRQCSQQCP